MTVWIEWAGSHGMYQINFIQGQDNATIYVPAHFIAELKFFLKRIHVTAINLGSTISAEQNDELREALR